MNNTRPRTQNRQHARFAPTFSLLTFLLLTLAACAFLGWISAYGARDRLAIAEIAKEDGHVLYDYDPPSSWRSSPRLKRLLQGTNFGEGLVWGAYQLSYYPTMRVTDEGLKHISEFPETKVLGLGETKITDEGMVHLAKLRELRVLYLFQTNISDSGLEHLSALTSLEFLSLENTAISDHGLEQLRPLRNLQCLSLDNTNITDVGLVHLYGLLGLQIVSLTGTSVTSVGVEQLRTALPDCQIDIQLPNTIPDSP